MKYSSLHLTLVIVLLFGASLACVVGGQSSQEATAQALSESVSLTATANAGTGFDSAANLATAEAQATANALSEQATQAALDALSAEDVNATAQAAAPFLAQLPAYGVEASQGRLAWVHPPETLSISGYLQYDFVNRLIGTVATDFVMSSDITWDTSGGLAGCGFALRADGNEEALNSYLAVASRGGNGRVEFASIIDGELKNFKDLYAYGSDPNFEWRNNTTNNLTVVAQGGSFKIYTNGAFIGEVVAGDPPPRPILPNPPVEPPAGAPQEEIDKYAEEFGVYEAVVAQAQASYQAQLAAYTADVPYFEKGFVAMITLSESGTTICEFNNTWLFLIEN